MRTNKRVSAIVTKGEAILLIHRRKEGREYWVVPGGGVEEGETLEQGLTREVKEETGQDLLGHNLIAENKDGDIEHYFYVCKLSDGELTLGGPEAEENSEANWFHLEWVDKNEIQNLSLFPEYLKKITNKIFS